MITEISNKIVKNITKEKETSIKERIQSCLKNMECSEKIDINFEDNYPLYFGGKELEEGVFVRIEVYNRKQYNDREKYRKFREEIRGIYINELNLPRNKVFVQFDDY